MAAFLTCLLSIFSYTGVNGYTKSTGTPIRSYNSYGWSGTGDDDLSYASCTSSSPVLVSCGLASGDHHIDGSYPSNGQCVAQNGLSNSIGVLAIALCVSNDYTCTYHSGPQSGKADDAPSTVGCTGDKIMISCSPWTKWNAIDGAYVGTRQVSTTINSETLCTAHNELGGGGVWAKGICCKYNGDDGYRLDCKTKWGPQVSNGQSYASCDYGYSVWGCSGYSKFYDSLAEYYRAGSCIAESVEGAVQAVATCCRLYKEPTPLPTTSPSPGPTPAPTPSPTRSPTNPPSLDPTNMPTASPTCAVQGTCASISMHCDNELNVSYAVDGVTFVHIASNNNWREETRLFFEDINIDSVLRFSCKDLVRTGGFIASIVYKGLIHSTTNPLSVGGFEVVASSDNKIAPLEYKPKTSDPWYIDNKNIGQDAYWVWNGGDGNTMTFEFHFDTVITAFPTLDPTPAPTRNPTKAPTTAAPSKPGTLSCGEEDTGPYNDVALDFTVRMLFPGDLTFDASHSAFNITSISAVYGTTIVGSDTDFDEILTLYDLEFAGDYIFTIRADESVSAQYDIRITCESANPTSSPTIDPTVEPTSDPSHMPTGQPTADPTTDPTVDPTTDPTEQPTTNNPTNAPTLAPTVTPTFTPTRSPERLLIIRPTKKPTQGVTTTESDDHTTAFESTVVKHDSGDAKGSNVSQGGVYIGISVAVVCTVCIGCIIYYFVVSAKKREHQVQILPTDTMLKTVSLDATCPPSTKGGPGTLVIPGVGTEGVQGEQKDIELVALVSDDDDDDDSDSTDSVFDEHHTQTGGMALPDVGENRMHPQASLPLPDLPRETSGSNTPNVTKGEDANSDSDDNDHDALYGQGTGQKQTKQ